MAYYETYVWAWLAYLLAATGLYFVVVKLTKYWIKVDAKNYTRLAAAAILFTPASHVMDGHRTLAPAFIVTLGELLVHGLKAAMQGLVPLLFALFLGAMALSVEAYIRAVRARNADT